jgi:hypothetical protein
MKKITILLILFSATISIGQTIDGTWKLTPLAGAFAVGPNQGNYTWYSSSAADVTTRACLFDDEYVFNANGTFSNVQGSQTWLEAWQGATDVCGSPVAPHNGSNAATYAYNSTAGTLTLNGVGAYLGLAKAINGAELTSPLNAPNSITYIVSSLTATEMTVEINAGNGWWRFKFTKQVVSSPIDGTWKLTPLAGAFAVGPNQGDYSWYSSSAADVTTRACLFDDEYVFNSNGSFQNILGSQTWLEAWQGATDVCGTPVAPHNGSNAATYAYNSTAGTLTLNGVGAYLGLAKAINGAELTSPLNAPNSITYIVSSLTATDMTVEINAGNGWWRFKFTKQVVSSPIEGTWKLIPQAGAFAVGPNQGNYIWYSSSPADVTTRACLFDDEYVFNANGTFSNVQGSQTWLEAWQGAVDVCGTPVAPHNGSNAATYTYNNVNGTLTLNGVGAYLGLAKAINGAELTSPLNAPNSITYIVSSVTSTELTVEINAGNGWWRFKFIKLGTSTCNDGIQNGDETGVDCGGSCTPCVSPPLVAAPTPPARNAWDVISLFSDAYSNISIDNWNQAPIWSPPTGKPVLDVLVATNPTKKIEFAGDGFIGVVLSSYTNATDMTHFHMDYWIPSSTNLTGKVLNPKLSNHAANPVGESNALLLTNLPPTAGAWVSLDVEFSTFTPQGATPSLNREVLKEFLIQSNLGDVYIDNIYLYRAATASADTFNTSNVKLYPNPTSTSLTIEAKNAIESISIYNVLGQEVMSKNPMSNSMTMDVSNLQNGLYFVNSTIEGKTSTTKFIKN